MGMTFLIRYAVGEGLIPIEMRLAGVAAVAIALLIWGWKQREKKSNFALVVQGGGIGLLYLTIFASFSLYKIIDSTPAFVLLGFVVIFAAVLAVMQNSKSLALFATAGGFLSPILTSSGSNNYIGLFSYYTLLNAGIFAVAWFKSWRILNFTGFVFTFAIAGIWGVLSYKPEFFVSTQPFLIIFFLMYVAIAVLFALKRPPNFKDTIDSSLVFGTPLLAFAMQCELVGDTEFGIAISAFILAAFYLLLASILWKRFSTRLALLCETFLSLAVIFATIAIPFAIDGSLTGSVWAIEGAGILWVSIRQQQFYRRLFAVALIFASGAIIGWEVLFNGMDLFAGKSAFLNSAFIGTTLIAISAAIASWLLDAEFDSKKPLEKLLMAGLVAFSALMMLGGFEIQVAQFNKIVSHGHLLLGLAVVTGLAFTLWASRWNWNLANWISLGYFALLIPAAALSIHFQDRLVQNFGYLLWPMAIASLFYSLARIKNTIPTVISYVAHGIAALLLAGLLFWEGLWQLLAGFSIVTIFFSKLGERMRWLELRQSAVLFLPVLLVCFLAAIIIDGDLVSLSSIDSLYYPPFKPGGVLWPFAFAVYFYLLLKAPIFSGKLQNGFYYAGAGLIAFMLLWLGLWPLLLGGAALSWLAYYLAVKNSWPQMRQLSLLLLPVMVAVPVIGLLNGVSDPAQLVTFNLDFTLVPNVGGILWPFALATFFLMAWLSEKENKAYSAMHHAFAMLFLVVIFTWMLSQITLRKFMFFDVGHLFLIPVISLAVIHSILTARQWPFSRHEQGFRKYALAPLAAITVGWSFIQFGSSGGGVLLPWIPFLNPLDLMQLVIIAGWVLRGLPMLKGQNEWIASRFMIGLAIYCFVWINVDILRVVHHWAGIDWHFVKLLKADVTQTLFSLVWSLLGLAGTFFAARKAHREIWIVSASLLVVVVLKLFIIDLSAQGTVERIVFFYRCWLVIDVCRVLFHRFHLVNQLMKTRKLMRRKCHD